MLLAPALLALALQTPADPLARLVPRDTVIYAQVPSLDQLLSAARRTRDAFDPSGKEPIDAEHFLKELEIPGEASAIDPKRPLAVCLTLAREPGASPVPVFLLPARSPEAFAKSLSKPDQPVTAIVDGGYVLVAEGARTLERGEGAAPIALDLPAGDLVARIDLARLIEQFRPMLDPLVDQMEGEAGPAVATRYADGFRDFLDSAQTLDLAVRLEGVRMELGLDLANKPGSVLAGLASKEKTDIRALARTFDTQAALNVLVGLDTAAMLKRMRPMLDALPEMYPDPLRGGIQQMLGRIDELGAQLGSGFSAAADFEGGGLRATYFVRPRDGAKLLECYKAMLTSVPGLIVEPASQHTVDGAPVTTWRMRFDAKVLAPAAGAADPEEQKQLLETMERLYGKDGLALHLALEGELCVFVIGGDEAYLRQALARASAGAQPLPASVQRALDRVGNMSPAFVMHYDIGRMMKGVAALAGPDEPVISEDMPELPFSILAWGGVEGPVWHGALGCDLDEVAVAMRAVEVERAARAQQAQARSDVAAIRRALEQFAANNGGKYPDSLEMLVIKDSNGAAYLEGEHPLTDPWGREYRYEAPSAAHSKPRVSTLGRDGKPGGLGADADFDSDALLKDE